MSQKKWDYRDPEPTYGLFRVRKRRYWGCIDIQGNLVVPCQWEYVAGIHEEFIIVKEGGLGVLRRDGLLVIDCQWHRILITQKNSVFLLYPDESYDAYIELPIAQFRQATETYRYYGDFDDCHDTDDNE